MGDDYLLEFLHMEMVNKFFEEVDGKPVDPNAAVNKLERLGFIVGQRYIERATRDIHRFKDELDAMKFICKDIWMAVYKKQIDNLRTNHHGVYNLHDSKFRFLEQLSSNNQYLELAPRMLAFPCGFLRGALCSLGFICSVSSEVTNMPSCKFLIQIQQS